MITVCFRAGEAAWGGCKQQQGRSQREQGAPAEPAAPSSSPPIKHFCRCLIFLVWFLFLCCEHLLGLQRKPLRCEPGQPPMLAHLCSLETQVMAGVAPSLPPHGWQLCRPVQCCQVRRLTAFPGKEMGGLGTHWEGLAHVGASKEQTWQD